MKAKPPFPVKEWVTLLPEGFHSFPLNLSQPLFRELSASGCTSVTPVESPAGWEIARGGDCEPDHVDLFFISSGRFRLETEEGTIFASGGDVLQVISWKDRYLEYAEGGRHIYVRFNNPGRYPLAGRNLAHPSAAVKQVDFFVRLLQEESAGYFDEIEYGKALVRLLHIIFQNELRRDTADERQAEEIVKLRRMINDSRRRNFEVLPIARSMGMSFSKFRTFCLENFGLPPRSVIENIRMARARGLLDLNLMTIDEIAAELGYADRFAFSKAFTRCNQISPGAFRKRYSTGK